MLQVSLKKQLRNMSEVASGECQCVSQIASAILLNAQHVTKIYKNLMQCLLEHFGGMKCNEDLLQLKKT